MSHPSPSAPAPRWLAPALLVPYCAAAATLWLPLALALRSQCGWMALLVATGAALLLRASGARQGFATSLLAASAVLATAAAANWIIIAAQVGAPLGLTPWESAVKLGPAHAWTLLHLASTRLDLACLVLGPLLAATLAVTGLSGRRRAP